MSEVEVVERKPVLNGKTQVVWASADWKSIQEAGKKVYHGSKEVCGIKYVNNGKYAVFYKLGLGKELGGDTVLEVK